MLSYISTRKPPVSCRLAMDKSLVKIISQAFMVLIMVMTLALVCPSNAHAVNVVHDPRSFAAINQLIQLIRTQTNERYLNEHSKYLNEIQKSLGLSSGMINAVRQATQNSDRYMNEFINYSQQEGAKLDDLAKQEGADKNKSDPRFYIRESFSASQTQNPSSCSSSDKKIGHDIKNKCEEIQNLRTYKVLHSGKFQKALSEMSTSIVNLSNAPPSNLADVQLKNQAINLIRLMQSQTSEIYRAQKDYIQARIEIAEEIRVAMVNQKSGTTSANSNPALGQQSQSAKALFLAAAAAAGFILR